MRTFCPNNCDHSNMSFVEILHCPAIKHSRSVFHLENLSYSPITAGISRHRRNRVYFTLLDRTSILDIHCGYMQKYGFQ